MLFNKKENLKSTFTVLVFSNIILEQPKLLKKSFKAIVVSKSTKWPTIPSMIDKNLVETK